MDQYLERALTCLSVFVPLFFAFVFSVEVGSSQDKNTGVVTQLDGDSGDRNVFCKKDTSAFEFFELHTLPAPKTPEAVLVLFYSPDKPKTPLTQADWKNLTLRCFVWKQGISPLKGA